MKKTVTAAVFCLTASVSLFAAAPSVLLVSHHGADWGPVHRLQSETGMVFGACNHRALTWERLQQFNTVILFDMERLAEPGVPASSHFLTPTDHDAISALLERFVHEGGGLYVYGVSFTHMGQGLAAESLNRFLSRFDAQSPFELLHDPPREQRQPGGRQVLYALADSIAQHPVTAGVEHLWYAIGPFSYGPWARPLVLGEPWTPLVLTSSEYNSKPLGNLQGHGQLKAAESAVKTERAVTYAAREFGKGRIILNGGESTISFFGYAFSPYADQQWQRIGMEKGLDDTPSHGYKLFLNSLTWLAAPSLEAGTFGGFQPPPQAAPAPSTAPPIAWSAPAPHKGRSTFQPGLVAVIQHDNAVGYAEAAKARGLAVVVAAGDFEKMEKSAWERLSADCAAARTEGFEMVPAVATRDEFGNRFIQAGPKAWPQPNRLSATVPGRVREQLGYWMNDADFPMRVIFHFSAGNYPPWLHSAYNSFGIRTWRDGQLIDESVDGYQQSQEQGDRTRIVAVHELSTPEQLTAAQELTWFLAPTPAAAALQVLSNQFNGNLSFVSTGPKIRFWHMVNAHRQTFGEAYVAGTERWRAILSVDSDVPLSRITVYDSTNLFRCYTVSGTSAEIQIDGLHDTRHVLTAVVEDVNGGRATTGAITSSDAQMRQTFCSDRCNIMGGSSSIRGADGLVTTVPASVMLYKAGRLQAATVGLGEALPGIDGSGQGVQFFLAADMRLNSSEPAASEERAQLHQIFRPWEAADGLIFNTPIAKRSPEREHLIYGHNPYVELVEPRVDAGLVQYHFYRNPMYPSPALAEFRVTARDSVMTKAGWQGLHVRFANAWGKIRQYSIVNADGRTEQGPDEKETTWRGTLTPGDSVYFPELGEGFYVVDGPLSAVLECAPSRNWFRIYTGRSDALELAAGESAVMRVLMLRVAGTGDQGLAQWRGFGAAFGLTGAPRYRVETTRGQVTSQRYMLEAEADDYGFIASVSAGGLPQRLPVAVHGLNPNWTAAKIDLDKRTWHPLGVWQGKAYTTLAPDEASQRLYIGNLLVADSADLRLTLLPGNGDGSVHAAVHNPTSAAITATVRVPVDSWLAKMQEHTVSIAPMSTEYVQLSENLESGL